MTHISLVHANVLHIDYFSYSNTMYHKYLLPRMIRLSYCQNGAPFCGARVGVMSYALRANVSFLGKHEG